jgi:hypothetical protein
MEVMEIQTVKMKTLMVKVMREMNKGTRNKKPIGQYQI